MGPVVKMVKAMIVISVAIQASQATGNEVLRCAERGTVLLAGECHLPLSQGPCPPGQIILASEEGTGSCSTWTCKEDEVLWSNGTVEECLEFDASVCPGVGERVWAKPDGGWECDCREDWGREGGQGECRQQGKACGQGRILQAASSDRCGNDCVHFSQCQHFMNQVTEATLLRRSGMIHSYNDLLEPMRDTVCNRKEKKVCCLSSSSSLPKLGREEQVLECQENPCRGELTPSIPWPGREGCFPLPANTLTSSCILVLHEDTDKLECENVDELGVRGVAVSAGRSRCSRRKVWSRFQGKCVRRF